MTIQFTTTHHGSCRRCEAAIWSGFIDPKDNNVGPAGFCLACAAWAADPTIFALGQAVLEADLVDLEDLVSVDRMAFLIERLRTAGFEIRPVEVALSAADADWYLGKLKQWAADRRHFIGTLTITGDRYLVPASRRLDWHAYDAAAEQTHEPGQLPDWCQPIGELEHLEFSNPREIM